MRTVSRFSECSNCSFTVNVNRMQALNNSNNKSTKWADLLARYLLILLTLIPSCSLTFLTLTQLRQYSLNFYMKTTVRRTVRM